MMDVELSRWLTMCVAIQGVHCDQDYLVLPVPYCLWLGKGWR